MFRDLKNLFIIEIPGRYNDNYIFKNYNDVPLLRIGFNNVPPISEKYNCGWDEAFYRQLGIPFNLRWDDFYFERDLDSEIEFFEPGILCRIWPAQKLKP